MEYQFENANLAGIGVFDNDTDNLVQFRGIVSDSVALTVTLDAGDNTIVLAFDQDALVADIPDANTTTRGILETATNAEAVAKAATNKILTPSNLAAIGSTDTFAGLVELATNAETQAGVSTTLAVTPAGLASTVTLSNTTTWADNAARVSKTPAFQGQFGAQLDGTTAWIADTAGVGSWRALLTLGSTNQSPGVENTFIEMNGDYIFFRPGSGGGGTIHDSVVDSHINGDTLFGGAATPQTVTFEEAVIDFGPSTTFLINAAPSGSAAVVTTNGSSEPVFRALSGFLSIDNTETGWGTPSSTLARTTFATYGGQAISNPPTQAEVQAIDNALVIVSQRLGALLTDLLAVKLPAA